MLRTRLIGVGLLSLLGAASAAAQTTYPSVKVTGRLQSQFYYFGNEDYTASTGSKSNFFIRRARIEARVAMITVGRVLSEITSAPTMLEDCGSPAKLMKMARPRMPKTIEGTAARFATLTSIRSVQRFFGANSSR